MNNLPRVVTQPRHGRESIPRLVSPTRYDCATMFATSVWVREGRVVKDTVKVKVAHTQLPSVYRVPELLPILGSQPASDVSHKPGGRLPLLSARSAVTPATLKRAATNLNFAAR